MAQARTWKLGPIRAGVLDAIRKAPDGYEVRLTEPKRTIEQNALMWSLLHEVSEQVIWHGQCLSPEDWKHMFTASLTKQRAVPGLDGGFVILGQSTSRMTKAEMAELVELIYVFGAQQGIKWYESV
jgi:hypothetical protein